VDVLEVAVIGIQHLLAEPSCTYLLNGEESCKTFVKLINLLDWAQKVR